MVTKQIRHSNEYHKEDHSLQFIPQYKLALQVISRDYTPKKRQVIAQIYSLPTMKPLKAFSFTKEDKHFYYEESLPLLVRGQYAIIPIRQKVPEIVRLNYPRFANAEKCKLSLRLLPNLIQKDFFSFDGQGSLKCYEYIPEYSKLLCSFGNESIIISSSGHGGDWKFYELYEKGVGKISSLFYLNYMSMLFVATDIFVSIFQWPSLERTLHVKIDNGLTKKIDLEYEMGLIAVYGVQMMSKSSTIATNVDIFSINKDKKSGLPSLASTGFSKQIISDGVNAKRGQFEGYSKAFCFRDGERGSFDFYRWDPLANAFVKKSLRTPDNLKIPNAIRIRTYRGMVYIFTLAIYSEYHQNIICIDSRRVFRTTNAVKL